MLILYYLGLNYIEIGKWRLGLGITIGVFDFDTNLFRRLSIVIFKLLPSCF
jgi:hypothetical protein